MPFGNILPFQRRLDGASLTQSAIWSCPNFSDLSSFQILS